MMQMSDGTVLAPPSAERIQWFEGSYRVRLPDPFREFLSACNGGVPTSRTFDCLGQERLIERFLPLMDAPQDDSTHGFYDITVVMSQVDDRLIDDEDLVGMNVIPIAALFGGDLLCLDFREDPGRPSVAVWSHEESDELEPVLYSVAEDFSSFIAALSA